MLWGQSDGARKRIRDSHAALLPNIEDLPTLVSTIEKINDDTVADYFKPMGKMNLELDRWLGLDDADLGFEVGQMLETFGIRNLSAFKGAISDRELVVALKNAGEIGQPVAMINAILQRSIRGTIDGAIEQNVGAEEMDRMLATTEVAKAAVATGQQGLWTNQFGFTADELGSEGTLNEETGLYEGGTGLMGMRRRADQAVEDALDAAIEEAGGMVLADPAPYTALGVAGAPGRVRASRGGVAKRYAAGQVGATPLPIPYAVPDDGS